MAEGSSEVTDGSGRGRYDEMKLKANTSLKAANIHGSLSDKEAQDMLGAGGCFPSEDFQLSELLIAISERCMFSHLLRKDRP